jgi:hypothetical protein
MSDYYDLEYEPEYLERRSAHRILPTSPLTAWMFAPPVEPLGGHVLEMSAQGIGIAAPLPGLASLTVEHVVELSVGADQDERLVTPARIVSALPLDEHWARYGLHFVHVGALDGQLASFFHAHFNRRADARARPLAHDVVRAQLQWRGGQLTARVHDLSVQGMALSISPRSPVVLKPDTEVALRFRLPGAVRSISGTARVRYAADLPRQRVIGLQFDLTDPRGITEDLPLVQAFVDAQLGRVEAWERTWTA